MKATDVTSNFLVATVKTNKNNNKNTQKKQERRKAKEMGESESNNLCNLIQYTPDVIIYHATGFRCRVGAGSVLLLEHSSAGPRRFQVLGGPGAHLLAPQWTARVWLEVCMW